MYNKTILFIFLLLFFCNKFNAQNNSLYSLSVFTSNNKVNNLAKDKAILIKQGKHEFKIKCDCGEINVKCKKIFKLKIKKINAVSFPCNDYLISIYEDILENLNKTKKINITSNSIIFCKKTTQLMAFKFITTN